MILGVHLYKNNFGFHQIKIWQYHLQLNQQFNKIESRISYEVWDFFDTKEQVVNVYDVTKITLVKINKKYPENLLNIIDLIVEIVYYKVVKNSKGDFVIWK